MRVLLIAHAYPRAPASGARRAGNVARALRAAGVEVKVITARDRRPDEGPARDEGEAVLEVAPHPSGADVLGALGGFTAGLQGLRRHVRGRHRGGVDAAPPPGPAPSGSETPVADAVPEAPVAPAVPDPLDPGPRLKRWLTTGMRFPDGQLGFLAPAVRAAAAHGGWADVLYTTGPPVTTHLAGLCAHAITGTPWVCEYRDPWVVGTAPYRAAALRTAATDALERALETRCLAAAAEVITVTEGIAGVLAPRRAALGRPDPQVVRNGIPELSAARPADDRAGPLRILHLGNLYAFRDPKPFFEALARVRSERSASARPVEVEFVGDPPPRHVRAQVEALDLGEAVRFVEWVPYELGQARVRDADILLLFAQRQPLQVPNKLYEYLGSRNRILAFADARGETARLLRRAGGHEIVTEEDGPGRAHRALVALLAGGRGAGSDASEDLLASLTTERQLAALPGILERALGAGYPA